MTAPGPCSICAQLPATELMEMDLIAADPLRWPKTIWTIFDRPQGGLPATYRRFGATQMVTGFLKDHGYTFERRVIRRHVRYDVPHVARDARDLVAVGVIGKRSSLKKLPIDDELDPRAFIRYFNSGIRMGAAAADMIADRINAMVEAGIEPDPDLLLELAKMGAKFATTQATLQTRGVRFGDEDDTDKAFMGPPDEAPQTIGHNTVKTIDGSRVVVRDEGKADRDAYNARRQQDGDDPLD